MCLWFGVWQVFPTVSRVSCSVYAGKMNKRDRTGVKLQMYCRMLSWPSLCLCLWLRVELPRYCLLHRHLKLSCCLYYCWFINICCWFTDVCQWHWSHVLWSKFMTLPLYGQDITVYNHPPSDYLQPPITTNPMSSQKSTKKRYGCIPTQTHFNLVIL